MAGYIRVRRCDVSEDSFERTKGLANEQAQDQHTQMLVCKVVGIVKTQEPVYEPLEEPEPPKPRRKVLDVELEQRDSTVMATVKHLDMAWAKALPGSEIATDGEYHVCFMDETRVYAGLNDLTVGKNTFSATDFRDVERAAEYVERITKLLDIINANEPQEGGEA
jgi:hypothetical protein